MACSRQLSRCACTKCRTLPGSGTRIIVVLLLDNLPALYEKCVEYIKRLAVRKANLCLPGRPATVTAVVAYEPKTADCGKNAIEKFKDRFASADQSVLPSCGI